MKRSVIRIRDIRFPMNVNLQHNVSSTSQTRTQKNTHMKEQTPATPLPLHSPAPDSTTDPFSTFLAPDMCASVGFNDGDGNARVLLRMNLRDLGDAIFSGDGVLPKEKVVFTSSVGNIAG